MSASKGQAPRPSPRARAQRPMTVRFDPNVLLESWDALAKLRKPGFSFDGASYAALGRSLNPAPESLAKHARPLSVLIDVAPTGFPSHPCLATTFSLLHYKHQIFGSDLPPSALASTCAGAADSWRIMCKHLYTMKKDGFSADVPADVQALLDKIELPKTELGVPADDGDAAAGVPIQASDVAGLFPDVPEETE
eukprot:7601429-Pyramimonas_sp.AAC.1